MASRTVPRFYRVVLVGHSLRSYYFDPHPDCRSYQRADGNRRPQRDGGSDSNIYAQTHAITRANGNRGPVQAEVVLIWVGGPSIADVDDISEMFLNLKRTPGIIGGYGNEFEITVIYDPKLINIAGIQKLLLDIGHPTRQP